MPTFTIRLVQSIQVKLRLTRRNIHNGTGMMYEKTMNARNNQLHGGSKRRRCQTVISCSSFNHRAKTRSSQKKKSHAVATTMSSLATASMCSSQMKFSSLYSFRIRIISVTTADTPE